MKTIVAGSRTILDPEKVYKAIETAPWEISEVVSGLAAGPDTIGAIWARSNNIPVAEFPAQWNLYGKRAGMLRNVEMAKYAEALVLVWDGKF